MSGISLDMLRPSLEAGEAQRIFIAGMTGSGKTTLGRTILQNRQHVTIHDWKGTMKVHEWRGYRRVTKLSELVKLGSQIKDEKLVWPKMIYAPIAEELNEHYYEAFFQWIFRRASRSGKFLQTVYVDEVTSVTHNNEIPDGYKALLTRGRDRGIEVISSSQRPSGIPQWILSEAERFFCFRLQLPQDREKMGGIITLADDPNQSNSAKKREADRLLKELPKRHFYYYDLSLDGPIGPLHLEFMNKSSPSVES